jgi:putative PEP-CTERM system TPR-repeat lipoprotein
MKRSSTARDSRLVRRIIVFVASTAVLGIIGCADGPERFVEQAKAYRSKGDNVGAELEIRNALKDYPRDIPALVLAGQIFADVGDLASAELALERALEAGAKRQEVVPTLARVLVDMEKFPEALSLLKVEGKPDPERAPLLGVLRGRAYLGSGALLEAKTEFNVSQNSRPSAEAKLGLAQVALAERDQDGAERLIAEVLQAEQNNVGALLLRARLLRQGNRIDEAVAVYGQAIKAGPGNPAPRAELAALELMQNRTEQALPLLKEAEALGPKSLPVLYAKALLAFKQKNNGEALKALDTLLRVVRKHGPGLLLTGFVQHAEGNYELAQSALASYLQRFPGDLTAWRLLGASLLAKGQPHLAVNVLAPVIGRTSDVALLAIAADAYRMMGRFDHARALVKRAMTQSPDEPDLHTNLALIDLASGARQRALAGLEAAIALGPRNSRADHALIMVRLGQNQIPQAQQAAAALEKRLPDQSATYVLLGAVQIVQKDWARARASLERALQIDPRNLQAVEALADVDAGEGKPDRRRERLEQILKSDPRHVGALLALARLDLRLGRQEKGVAAIRRALSEQPQSGNALLILADTQFRHGQLGEAIISARQAHDLHPFDTRAIAVLAEAQMAMGDKAGAIATLTKLITIQPDVVSGYLRLGAAHLGAGDAKAAAATVLAGLEKEPKNAGARALLADVYLELGDLERAEALAQQVQKDDPAGALGHRIEGDVMLARKEYGRALNAYKKAAAVRVYGALLVRMHRAQSEGTGQIASDGPLRAWLEKNPDDTDTRFYVANVLARAGRHREATEQYREILRLVPDSASALNDLAWSLHAAGDRQALDYARQAVNLAPTSAAILDTLGWILVERGEVTEGIPILLKATELDGTIPEIRYHLVQGLLKIGDTARAKAELARLLQSSRPFPQLAEARVLASKLGL